MRLTVVKYIRTVKPKNAEGLVAQIYTQIKRDFGRVVEPFSLHSPSPRLLAGAWMASRESELTGRVPREDKEAVAASISKLNQCPYCVDAHTIMLGATGENKLANQISSGRYGSITESRTRAIVKWALATRTPDSEVLRSPPFSPKEAPEIIGTAVFYHYLNSMVTVFLGETPLPTSLPWLRGPLKRFASGLFSKAASRPKKEGESLRLLEEAKLPSDLGWTKETPNVAGAYARFAKVIEETGKEALPSQVRKEVTKFINNWQGKTPKLGRSWLEQMIKGITNSQKVATRLAVLTALSPHQVNEILVKEYMNSFPGEEKLLGALAWASFTKARKIGSWLAQ